MESTVGKWLRITLVNLGVVALLGVTLRYKIAFSLPFIDQRNLHHGHSHFAFAGWISQAIMILFVYYLYKNKQEGLVKRYKWILFANLVVSYGMLISFSLQGYAFISILFSTLSVFVSYIFAILFWKDLNKLNLDRNSHLWFKASLLFNVISSLGPFFLAFMKANHIIDQKKYLVAEYFYLHFQYNGWFLFACIGLFVYKLTELIGEEKSLKNIFWIFAISFVPCFFLSALWLPIHKIIYLLVVVAAMLQMVGWVWLIRIVRKNISILKSEISKPAKWLMSLAAISMSIKLILQLGSTYPALSQLAFGFRPIIIGYLHLVFLALISVFILGYIIAEKLIVINQTITVGIVIFVSGIFINEILLMFQGVYALATERLPYINELLLFAAIIMFTGIFLIVIKQFSFQKTKS
ncbi:MAG: hypothetical protein Q7W13_07430 [Bacteroidia bacterium]|nr:hypothetical protein [Bacteroidia bacterium]